jgi:hypothetical protein
MRRILLLFYFGMGFTGFVLAQAPAQEVISAAGGSAKTSSMAIDWTVGEPVIETASGQDRMYTQGFHQPKLLIREMQVSSQAEDSIGTDKSNWSVKVLPNPFSATLTLQLKSPTNETLEVQIMDMQARTLYEGKIFPEMTTTYLDVRNYPPGTYHLRVLNRNGEIISAFQLSKIQN